jgi:pimeloyl-ACP methyl ester carboxylesterase
MENPLFVQITTTDGLTLPGLFYEAPHSQKAMIYLHGNGSSSVFYSDDERLELAKSLNKKGISLLMFNNRGAHYIKKLHVTKNGEEESKYFGMAYEKIKECIEDIDGAVAFLKTKEYKTFYLIGESTGANKICVYHFYKPTNEISKYILVSGGDDTGIYYDYLGKKKFYKLLREAEEKIKKHEGEDLIKELLPDEFFSYQAFYDTCNPDGDYNVFPYVEEIKKIKLSTKPLFRHAQSIGKPTLVIYGEKDQYALGGGRKSAEILKKYCPNFTYENIKDADHALTFHQKEYAKIVTDWL